MNPFRNLRQQTTLACFLVRLDKRSGWAASEEFLLGHTLMTGADQGYTSQLYQENGERAGKEQVSESLY